MALGINLLPWRIVEFRRKSKKMLLIVLMWGLTLCLSLIWLVFLQRQIEMDLNLQQKNASNIKQQLSETQQKITALQQKMQGQQDRLKVPQTAILPFLALLQQLPLTKGELKQLDFSAHTLNIQGWVADQAEFERLDQFLHQFTWLTQVKLEKLEPQQQGDLHFEYQLIFAHKAE